MALPPAPSAAANAPLRWLGPRRGDAVSIAVVVIVLHVLLGLALWWQAPPLAVGDAKGQAAGGAAPVFATLPRTPQAAEAAETAGTATPEPTTPAPRAAPATMATARPLPEPEAAPPSPAATALPAPAAAAPATEPTTASTESPAETPAGAPPRYRTQMPAPARLSYRLQRGGQHGRAVLDWQFGSPAEGSGGGGTAGYRLSLGSLRTDGPAAPRERWAWASQGGFDGHGLAPRRYADVVGGAERRSVNFQREAQLVTWSASERQQALPAGLQDRVSWLVQLAAVLNAEPTLRQPGQRLELWVAGLRGELYAWRLEVRGGVALPLADGRSLPTLHLVHEPLRPWAPRIELWLDPQMGHLPAKLSFAGRPPLEPLELLRDDGAAPPKPGS